MTAVHSPRSRGPGNASSPGRSNRAGTVAVTPAAVEMVRKVRDEEYQKTLSMSRDEWLRYLKESGHRATPAGRARHRNHASPVPWQEAGTA